MLRFEKKLKSARTAQQLLDYMRWERQNFSTREGKVNPQLDVPLAVSEFMIVENLHAGLRLCPSELRQLTTVRGIHAE